MNSKLSDDWDEKTSWISDVQWKLDISYDSDRKRKSLLNNFVEDSDKWEKSSRTNNLSDNSLFYKTMTGTPTDSVGMSGDKQKEKSGSTTSTVENDNTTPTVDNSASKSGSANKKSRRKKKNKESDWWLNENDKEWDSWATKEWVNKVWE